LNKDKKFRIQTDFVAIDTISHLTYDGNWGWITKASKQLSCKTHYRNKENCEQANISAKMLFEQKQSKKKN